MEVILEKHPDGHVGYSLGMQGVLLGEGETFEGAHRDVKSAIKFHVEGFGPEALER
jgi:hypothetical protein